MRDATSRRTILGVIGISALSGCSSILDRGRVEPTHIPDDESQLSINSIPSNWRLPRHDSKNTGSIDAISGNEFDGLIWSTKTNGGVFTEPIISDERIFYLDLNRKINARDAKTGELLWSKNDGAAFTPLAADNQHVYLLGVGTGLLARDTENGNLAWENELMFESFTGPQIYENSIYFGDSHNSNLEKYDGSNGELKWRVHIPNLAGPLAIDTDGISALKSSGEVVFLDHSNNIHWKYTVGNEPSKQIIYGSNILITTRNGEVISLDKGSGDEQWQYDSQADSIISYPTLSNDRIFLIDNMGKVHAVSNTGDPLWMWDTDTTGDGWRGELFNYEINATNNNIYALGFDHHIHVIDPSVNEPQLESYWEGDLIPSPPIVIDNTAYILSDTNHIKVVKLK